MTIEQVEAIGGKFYDASSKWLTPDSWGVKWFVPTDNNQPVMMKLKDGTWGPRGF